ncbi:hypothetical protein ACFVAO_21030, partial [Streptomyces californicus]
MSARPEKGEPDHFRLGIGHAFTTECADVGQIREAEATGAARAPLADVERLVGSRPASRVRCPDPDAAACPVLIRGQGASGRAKKGRTPGDPG